MAGADSAIDVGRNTPEIFEHRIKRLTCLNGDQRFKNRTRTASEGARIISGVALISSSLLDQRL